MSQRRPAIAYKPAGLILLVFLILLITSGLILLITSPAGLATAWVEATTHQPERYTALYFDHPAQLPSYAPTRKPQTIPFRIVNHEHEPMTYQYESTVIMNGVTTIKYGTVRLLDNENAVESVSFTIPHPLEVAFITVQLTNTHQQITFRSTS